MKEDLEPDFKIKNILCDVGSPCGADDLKIALESKGLSLGFKTGKSLSQVSSDLDRLKMHPALLTVSVLRNLL